MSSRHDLQQPTATDVVAAQPDGEGQERRAEQRRPDDDADAGVGEPDGGEVARQHDADDPVPERPDAPRLEQHDRVTGRAGREDPHAVIIPRPAAVGPTDVGIVGRRTTFRRVTEIPMRIVSLLPSATEILFALGLDDAIVGVTFECDVPAAARTKPIVSTSALPEGLSPGEIDAVVKARVAAGEDLYHLDRGAFAAIDPTLVVTQDLCTVSAIDVTEVDDAIAWLGCSADVLTLDPATLADVLATITTVGAATGTEDRAAAIVERARTALDAVRVGGRRRTSPPHAGAGVDRPGVHGRPLGARPGHRSRRRGRPRASRRPVGRRGVGRHRGVRRRRRDRRAVRLRPRRGGDLAAGVVDRRATCRPAPRSGPSTPTASSCGQDRGSSPVSRRSRRSCTPSEASPGTRRRAAGSSDRPAATSARGAPGAAPGACGRARGRPLASSSRAGSPGTTC